MASMSSCSFESHFYHDQAPFVFGLIYVGPLPPMGGDTLMSKLVTTQPNLKFFQTISMLLISK